MKVKVNDIVNVYPILMEKVGFSKLSGKAKMQIVKLLHGLKKVNADFMSLRELAIEKFVTDDFKKANDKLQKPSEFSQEELHDAEKVVRESDEAFRKMMADEAEKEVEIEFEKMNEEDFEALLDGSKDLTAQDMIVLSEFLN